MSKEFKYINLAQFKASDEGAGSFEGYAAVFNEIDEGGDIILKGAFADTIDEFLSSGFTAHSHDWAVSGVIGYPTEAKEDDYGFFVASAFHSTPDAQLVRVKAQERMAAGKQVGLSIGYKLAEAARVIYPKDYASELPKYIRPEVLGQNLEKAKQFTKIRLLSKLHNFEHSIVTAPMMKLARATAIKSNDKPESISVKGMFEERLEERTNSLYNLYETLCYVLYQIQYMASAAQQAGTALDAEALLDEALNEFTARVRSAVVSKLQSGDSMDAFYYYGRAESDSKINQFLSVKSSPASGLTLAERSELAASASEEFAQRSAEISTALKGWSEDCKSKQEARTKEGRTISQATATRIEQAKAKIDEAAPALEEVSTALSDLLDLANPKEKADPSFVEPLLANFYQLQFQRLKSARRL